MNGWNENSYQDMTTRERLVRLQLALGRIGQTLLRAGSREAVLQTLCDSLVHDAGYLIAWVGWLNERNLVVVPAVSSGDRAAEYLQLIKVSAGAGEEGQGPTGSAIREGHIFVCNNFLFDPRTTPWHEAARKTGIRSSVAIPFRDQTGKVCGTLNVYSDQPGAFTQTDVNLLEEMTAEMSLELSKAERSLFDRSPSTLNSDENEMFKKFVNAAGEVFWIMNVQPELVLYVNPAFENVWGRPASELYRNPRLWMDSIDLNDRPRISELFSNWIQNIPGAKYDVEYRILRADGETRWISDKGFALLRGDGPISKVAGIASDITTRKLAQESARLVGERYKSILDNMLEGCMIIGYDWTYVYVNDAAARHGYQEKENLVGRTMMSVYKGVENSTVFRKYKLCMEERTPQKFESNYTFEDGTTNWYEIRVSPVPEGIFVMSLDITERIHRHKTVIRRRKKT